MKSAAKDVPIYIHGSTMEMFARKSGKQNLVGRFILTDTKTCDPFKEITRLFTWKIKIVKINFLPRILLGWA